MTHDYKAALDEINRIFYYEAPVWVSIYKEPKLSDKVMYTIRHALTLAAEYERVKKERDELAEKLNKVVCGICNQPLTSKSDESHNCYGVHEWCELECETN